MPNPGATDTYNRRSTEYGISPVRSKPRGLTCGHAGRASRSNRTTLSERLLRGEERSGRLKPLIFGLPPSRLAHRPRQVRAIPNMSLIMRLQARA